MNKGGSYHNLINILAKEIGGTAKFLVKTNYWETLPANALSVLIESIQEEDSHGKTSKSFSGSIPNVDDKYLERKLPTSIKGYGELVEKAITKSRGGKL